MAGFIKNEERSCKKRESWYPNKGAILKHFIFLFVLNFRNNWNNSFPALPEIGLCIDSV